MITLHKLHRLGGNLATLIIARHLLRAGQPQAIKEIESPTDRQQTVRHLDLLQTLGLAKKVGIDQRPVAGSGRRACLWAPTDLGRRTIQSLLTE